MHRHRAALNTVVATVTLLVGCGGGAAPAGPSPATSTSTSAPPATPDDQRVVVLDSGVGVYLETTFSVALVHNTAGAHTARNIAVHLVITAGTRTLGTADARVDALAPGATAPAGARVQASAAANESVTASVTVGSWEPGTGPAPPATVGRAQFSCPRCGSGAGSGNVTTSVTLDAATAVGLPLMLTAVCNDAAGHIVGGGARLFAPPAGARTGIATDIPAVVSSPPTTCTAAVGPGGL